MYVSRLSVTPVKGTQLHDLNAIDLTQTGAAGNRMFYLIDERGLLFNGKQDGRLVQVEAHYDRHKDDLALRFPDGSQVDGKPVAAQTVSTNFYGRPVSGRVLDGPWAQALSKFLGRAVAVVVADRPGAAVDVEPVTIVSQASLESLRASGYATEPNGYQRFRTLLELDGPGAYEEDAWYGRRMTIGPAEIEITGPVPRCVVTSQDPLTGLSDCNMLAAIKTVRALHEGKIFFGVYGRVTQPGRISLGDRAITNAATALPNAHQAGTSFDNSSDR